MAAPPEGLVGQVLRFARSLRLAGAGTTTGQGLAAVEALTLADLGSRLDFKNTLKTCLVSTREDREVFDYWFDVFFTGLDRTPPAGSEGGLPPDLGFRQRTESDALRETDRERSAKTLAIGASLTDIMAERDFAQMEPEEIKLLQEQVRLLARGLAARLKRRHGRAGQKESIDFRRTFRSSLQQGGELIDLKHRRIKPRRFKILLLADVSGSMAPYVRFFLSFMFGLSEAVSRTEAFVFSTRLVRVTRELNRAPAGKVLENLTKAGLPFSGGTDIGGSLEQLLSRFGSGLLTRHTIVFILSDGWDRGRPERLGRAMKRIQREAGGIYWLNPLASDPGYEPLARGMAAARPYIDALVPFSRLSDIRRLAKRMGGIRMTGRLPATKDGNHERGSLIYDFQG